MYHMYGWRKENVELMNIVDVQQPFIEGCLNSKASSIQRRTSKSQTKWNENEKTKKKCKRQRWIWSDEAGYNGFDTVKCGRKRKNGSCSNECSEFEFRVCAYIVKLPFRKMFEWEKLLNHSLYTHLFVCNAIKCILRCWFAGTLNSLKSTVYTYSTWIMHKWKYELRCDVFYFIRIHLAAAPAAMAAMTTAIETLMASSSFFSSHWEKWQQPHTHSDRPTDY